VALRLDADDVDHVRPFVAAVDNRHPSRAARRVAAAARKPPAGARDKLPHLVLRRANGDPVFDTVFHDNASLAPGHTEGRVLHNASNWCNSTLADTAVQGIATLAGPCEV